MVTLEYRLFDQCDVRYFQVFLRAEIKSGLRTGICKGSDNHVLERSQFEIGYKKL